MTRPTTKPQWRERGAILAPYYTLCTTFEMYRDVVTDLGMPWVADPGKWANPSGATTTTFESPDGKLVCLVGMELSDRSGVTIAGMLVHEAVHIWQAWCEWCGEENPGDETEAYFIQRVSQELMNEYVRQTGGHDLEVDRNPTPS